MTKHQVIYLTSVRQAATSAESLGLKGIKLLVEELRHVVFATYYVHTHSNGTSSLAEIHVSWSIQGKIMSCQAKESRVDMNQLDSF